MCIIFYMATEYLEHKYLSLFGPPYVINRTIQCFFGPTGHSENITKALTVWGPLSNPTTFLTFKFIF